MSIEVVKQRMRNFTDSAGFDLSADIDGIKNEGEAIEILQAHRDWLDDLSNEAKRSTDDFENELFLEPSPLTENPSGVKDGM